MSDPAPSTSRRPSFVVTGFGPFRNVPENPTTVLANRLVAQLNEQSSSLRDRTTTRIFETSAEAVREAVTELHSPVDVVTEKSRVVFLHLGVNYKGKTFELEKCAYNEAAFRIPDERGYQPKKCCIQDALPLGVSLETDLPVSVLCDSIKGSVKDCPEAVCSEDPGRFVCNYVYFCSLEKGASNNRAHSLFLHVPPFSVVPEEKQLQVVIKLMEAIDRYLAGDVADC